MISESSFNKFQGSNGIAISRSVPRSYKGERCLALAPSWNLLNDYKSGKVTDIEYKIRFYDEVLSKLNKEKVRSALDGKVLLCWEDSGFCHRFLVLQWLKE